MTKLRALLAGAALAALAGYAIAQTVAQINVTGNECWNAGQGPGGPSNFLCLNLVRNGTALSLVSGSGTATTVMTTAQSSLFWVGTAPTTWAITLPTPAFDGEIASIGSDTTLTTLVTVTPASGQTMDGTYNSQTLTAPGGSAEFQFSFGTLKWYRIR
jgi:hypothetical protein